MGAGIRSYLPTTIKRPVREVLRSVDRVRRNHDLAVGIKHLKRQAADGRIDPALLADVRAAWGNEGFVADTMFLAEIAERMLASSGPYLECGSGITTLVAGVIADARKSQVWSLEQNFWWHARVKATLQRFGVSSVGLCYAPVRLFGDFAWYDLAWRVLPSHFSHVFCDGPAILRGEWIEPIYRNWRRGLVPMLHKRGVTFGELILDDASDARAEELCEYWNALGLTTEVVATPTGPFVRARPAFDTP